MEHQTDFLMHHGVEGQKWGHKHGPPYPLDDNPSKQAYKKHKAAHGGSDNKPKSQREIAKQERADYKKKKLPKTSFGLLFKNKKLSESEYREASKKIKRDREVYDGIIHDLYNLEKALNLPGQFLNDGVKTMKNVDYIVGMLTGTSMYDAAKMSASNRRSKKTKLMNEFKVVEHSDMITIPSLQHDDMKDVDNYLCHYGVLGMKWGIRRGKQKTNQPVIKRLSNEEIDLRVKEMLDHGGVSKRSARLIATDDLKRERRQKIKDRNYAAYLETKEGQKKAFDDTKNKDKDIEKYKTYMLKNYLKEHNISLYHSDFQDSNFLAHYGRKGMKWGQHIFGDDPNYKTKAFDVKEKDGKISGYVLGKNGNKKEINIDTVASRGLTKQKVNEILNQFQEIDKTVFDYTSSDLIDSKNLFKGSLIEKMSSSQIKDIVNKQPYIIGYDKDYFGDGERLTVSIDLTKLCDWDAWATSEFIKDKNNKWKFDYYSTND